MEKEFEESFEQIYDKIRNSCEKRLNEVKKQNRDFLLKIFAVLSIINIIIYIIPETNYLTKLTLCISACVLMILMISGNSNYRKIYKDNVIEGLVKGYNEKYYFNSTQGITKLEYEMSHFDNSFDEYRSEDRIFGTLESGDNFQIAEVVTNEISRTTNSEGKQTETRTETFRGIFGIIRLQKNLLSRIHIVSNWNLRKYSKNRLEMDSAQFEENFDCLTPDKVTAMRVFTSELIEKYLEIVKNNKKSFELKIENDMIYFRYKTNKLFEPPVFGSGLNKEFLKKYYKTMYYPIEIVKSTAEHINHVIDEN